MKITELLDRRSISLNGSPASKKEALDQMVALMVKSGKIRDEEAYREEVYHREEEGTTGIGEGIAIPHGKCDAVIRPGLAAMVIKNGVDFDSLDGEPVNLIFLIAAPNTKDNVHLDVLSKLSMLLMDEKFVEDLKNAPTVDKFLEVIDRADQEKADVDDQLAAQAEAGTSENVCRILAVTSCPTGIAHTYMAAEGIEKAAKAAGCFVKVETRGSGGAKNILTDQEIKDADCIIVAADAQVPMDRFDGKKLIECAVTDGISKADKLVERAMNGEASVYHADNPASEKEKNGSGSAGHKIYTQLMNGVSHMLPFVVGGGILIALATLLFKNKFTKQERESGPVNFIMGLAFITEGAIPFAASDPLHVLPSCIVGSALAGALSMAFGCTLMAPHGGIFVFPVVTNPLMYFAALVIGTVVGALILGVLKKKIRE